MSSDAVIDVDATTSVTVASRQHPVAGANARYEDWLRRIVPAAQTFAGHQGVNIIRPHGPDGAYTVVLHFDTVAHLRAWLDSPTRLALVAEVRPILRTAEELDIRTGLEFWFTPSGGKVAKPYKQFLITLSAIFPLTMLVPWLLGPLFGAVPSLGLPGISHFLVAVLIVGAMIFIIMPRYTRLASRWLFSP